MHHLANVIKTVEVGGYTLYHPYTLAFNSVRVGFDYAVHCLQSGLTNNSYCRVLSYAARHGLTRLGWKTATGSPFPRPVSRTDRSFGLVRLRTPFSRVNVLLPRRRGCFHMGLFNKFAHGICEQPCESLGVMVKIRSVSESSLLPAVTCAGC